LSVASELTDELSLQSIDYSVNMRRDIFVHFQIGRTPNVVKKRHNFG
jgi:hypothetical protein